MRREGLTLHLAAVAVTAVILAPLAKPGYVLSYDMVFVPRQPVRADLIAPVDAAPRAVPLDAIVSLAGQLMPGWLLQRIVLVAIIWAAVVGAGRLIRTGSLAVRVIAGVAYAWTPFFAERLLLGQWALLVAYAALPWLIRSTLDYRDGQRRAIAGIMLSAGLSAVTATGGLIAAAVCLAILPWRRWAVPGGLLLLLNSPWLVAAFVTDAGGRSDPAGVAAFAVRAENWGGAVVALLGTGGIWNQETTPASRASFLVPFLTLGLLLIGLYGYPIMRRQLPAGFLAVAGGGLVLAALSAFGWGLSVTGWLVASVPGAGLLRDAQKFVLPYALLLALCVAAGAQRLAERLPREPGRVVLAGVLLLFVMGVPDLAYGGAGALKPVRYPSDWDTVAQLTRADPGEMVSLPLSEYRRYSWNNGRIVIDPAPRYFPVPVFTDDTLIVGDTVIEGENLRARHLRQAIASGKPLAAEGFRWILVQHRGDATGGLAASSLDGLTLAFSGEHLALYSNPQATASTVDGWRRLPVIAAMIAALLAVIIAAGTIAVHARR